MSKESKQKRSINVDKTLENIRRMDTGQEISGNREAIIKFNKEQKLDRVWKKREKWKR